MLDEYRQTPRGSSITYLDLQTGRVVIGSSSGSKVAATEAPGADSKTGAAGSMTPTTSAGTANANRSAATNDQRQKPTRSNVGRDSANTFRIRLR